MLTAHTAAFDALCADTCCFVLLLQVVEQDQYVAELHARAEKFDAQAERTFGYLQVGSTKYCAGAFEGVRRG